MVMYSMRMHICISPGKEVEVKEEFQKDENQKISTKKPYYALSKDTSLYIDISFLIKTGELIPNFDLLFSF